jgi:hypothetical protein
MTDTPTMTRAEAVCACTNIIEAVEALDDILPANYSTSVHDKMQSMREYIKGTPQYPNVTQKMDISIRNTWAGLQKWNRKGAANKELFYGLSDVIDALNGVPAAVENEPCSEPIDEGSDAPPAADLPPVEGVEDDSFSAAMLAGMSSPLKMPKPRPISVAAPAPSKFMDPPAGYMQPRPTNDLPPTRAWVQERISKARENIIAVALGRFHEKGIRVIDIAKVKHGDLSAIMKMSSSDRTQQLLEAAWLSGYISGAKCTAEELEELLKKEK